MASTGDGDIRRLRRLITFLPFNLVEDVVVRGATLEPRVQWLKGCLLAADLSLVGPRTRGRGAAAADEELGRVAADLGRALQRILEDVVFPRGEYLLKFSDAGIQVMFTERYPGQGLPGPQPGGPVATPARRAARCGVDLLQALRKELAGNLTVRAAVEEGRFRLALCGKPGQRLERLALGDMCRTVARLKEAAQPGELVAGPNLLAELEACRPHVGPQRGTGRRLVEVPNEVAAPALPTVNLESLFTAEAESKLRVLMPPAVGERVEASDHALIGPGEIRPVVVAAFPLAVDYRDDAEDNAVLLDLNAGVDAIMTAVQAHGGLLLRLDVLGGGSAALAAFGVSQTLRRATRDAVSCALWLSQRMAKRRTNWGVRAGIEAGRAYMGELGSPLKREVALVGGPAVVALDLARHAGTAQVLVGETAWRLAGTAVRGRSLGHLDVGDPPRHWGVYEAAGLSPPPPSSGAVLEPAPAGSEPDALAQSRTGVRARLLDMLQGVIVSSQGCAVVVHGPPGRGKSSLLGALAEQLVPALRSIGLARGLSTPKDMGDHVSSAPGS